MAWRGGGWQVLVLLLPIINQYFPEIIITCFPIQNFWARTGRYDYFLIFTISSRTTHHLNVLQMYFIGTRVLEIVKMR